MNARQGANPDPLEEFKIDYQGKCWWCGNVADSTEHKYKHSDLRQIADPDGNPRSVYKVGQTFTGSLRSLRKGGEIRWSQNLCARCNNAISQPFDRAYDRFVEYVLSSGSTLHKRQGIDWEDVFGESWGKDVTNLSRYFVKQFGCMMATKSLPVPQDAIEFLNGAAHMGPVVVLIYRDWHFIYSYEVMKQEDPNDDSMLYFIGLPDNLAYTSPEDRTKITGADFSQRIGYILITVQWRAGVESVSMHDVKRISMPLINGDQESRKKLIKCHGTGLFSTSELAKSRTRNLLSTDSCRSNPVVESLMPVD